MNSFRWLKRSGYRKTNLLFFGKDTSSGKYPDIIIKALHLKFLRWLMLGFLLNFSFTNGYTQCPDYAQVNSLAFNNATGDAIFYLTATNADSVYVWFGDGNETSFRYISVGDTLSIYHRYSLDNRYYSSPYYATFYFFNTANNECYPTNTWYEVYFQNKNCMLYTNTNTYGSRKASFNVSTFNNNEELVNVQLLHKGVELESFNISYYSSYASSEYVFPKAGWDTILVRSTGGICSSIDTVIFYLYGDPCSQVSLNVTKNDSVNHTLKVLGANANSIYYWEFLGRLIDSVFTTSNSSITINLPMNDQINVWVYAYDSINDCYSNWLDTLIVTGNQQCYAYFYYYQMEGNGYEVQFYNYSIEGKKYLWNFGDGSTSNLYDPGTHTYTKDGLYTVTLTVTDEAAGCVQTYEKRIAVGNVSCIANFSYSINGQTVTFTDQSTGAAEVYWDFDDGGWSYDYNPTYTYSEPGIYEVYLYIWHYSETSYCSDWIVKTITVGDINSLVKADFDYFTEDNMTFTFSENSRGNAKKYYWTFGDGTTSTTKTVQKTYAKPGIYNVCLTVTNAEGKVSSYCEYVWAGEAICNLAAKFTYRTSKNNEKVIEFSNSSQGSADNYYWDFGDGSVSMDASPTYTYNKAGYYLVSLTAYNSQSGCMDTYYAWVQIGTVDCKADFDYMVDANELTVTLRNKSKAGEGALYYWFFDDGDYSDLPSPSPKTFEQPGKHYVGLMIFDINTICYDYSEKYIQVGDMPCSAEFSYIVDTAKNTIQCYNKSLGSSTYLFWYFGDGSYSFESNPKHHFAAPGYYTVGLATYDENSGCMDYFEKVVQITGAGSDCVAEFTYYIDNTTRTVNFFNNSYGTIVKYLWNFGDGKSSSQASPSNQYNVAGYYNVCLTVVNDKGISDITCKRIKVAATENTDCLAKFIFAIDPATSTAKFVSKSIGKPNSFSWDFGDNSTGSGEKVTHQYTSPNYYLVGLKISTSSGCKSEAYQLINIGMPDTLKAAFAYKDNESLKKAGGYPVDFIGAGLGDEARIKWTFGDGASDTTTTTPTHVYSQPGTYEVCYEITDPITGASDKHCQMVTVTGTNINLARLKPFELYPLPFGSELNMKITLTKSGNVRIYVTDLSGRTVATLLTNQKIGLGSQILRFNTTDLKRGSYLLKVETTEGTYQQLIIKQ